MLEGGEGCGKSTQADLLAGALDAVLTREPGGTDIGAQVRRLLLDRRTVGLNARAEALLMAADRAQHVAEVIAPALLGGRHVVCDRFTGSSVAYQGYGRGMDVGEIRDLSAWATAGLSPDLVLLIDVPREAAVRRLNRDLDRFEREAADFHQRVRDGFLAQAEEASDIWCVIDGDASIEIVRGRVRSAVAGRLGL